MRIEKGNALFMILIAVALFSALSFAATQGFRGSSASISNEQSDLYADEILTYAKQVENGVMRLISLGVSENDLCFDIDQYPGGNADYEHAGCANTRHRVFHPDGGGVGYKSFTEHGAFDVVTERFNANNAVTGVGSDCAAQSCTELLYLVRFRDETAGSIELCNAINKRIGINLSVPPIDTAISTAGFYTGAFTATAGGSAIADGGQALELVGKHSGCLQETTGGANDYSFYHVLLAR